MCHEHLLFLSLACNFHVNPWINVERVILILPAVPSVFAEVYSKCSTIRT